MKRGDQGHTWERLAVPWNKSACCIPEWRVLAEVWGSVLGRVGAQASPDSGQDRALLRMGVHRQTRLLLAPQWPFLMKHVECLCVLLPLPTSDAMAALWVWTGYHKPVWS